MSAGEAEAKAGTADCPLLIGCVSVAGRVSRARLPTHMACMAGRVKRKAGLAAAEALTAREAEPPPPCVLCERPLGTRIEWHHLVPKSQGGRSTAPIHPICHRTIHATLANRDLARDYADPAALRAQSDIARFLRWIADKPPDFNAPVRRGG